MPYEEYFASCSFSPYTNQTFSNYFTSSGSGSFLYRSDYFGETGQTRAGKYSYSAYGSRTDSYTDSLVSRSGSARIYESTSYSLDLGKNTASYIYNELKAYYAKAELGYLTINSDAVIVTDGAGSYTAVYAIGTVETTSSTTYEINFPYIEYNGIKESTTTTLDTYIRKTSVQNDTYYGPLEGSEVTYNRLADTLVPHTYSNIKTTRHIGGVITSEGGISNTMNIEWIGYSSGGDQNLCLLYTETASNKDVSEYASVLMETDSFSSSNKIDIFSYGASFSNDAEEITYTITYDTITTSAVQSQTTTLEKLYEVYINSFFYGFIKTNTTNTTIYTAGTSTQSVELVSRSEDYIFTYGTAFVASGVSYTDVQTISTTSNFTKFVELSGLNKATSFSVRSFVTTTASFKHRNNVYGVSVNVGGIPDGRRYSFAPSFPKSVLSIRVPEVSNPDTFYTEKASFASFAEPNYSTAYKNYSPADCSLVFLALIPLNTDASDYNDNEKDKYPSWISVYNGTFTGDRATTSLSSVTINQSSSYVGSGSTNVYQTISYFIENNSASQTTRTRSIPMALQDEASSVSRLARTKAENLDSAYINAYLPSIPIEGSNVFFTQGLQAEASYNMDRLLLNAYTTALSTFAESATSSFPISTSFFSIYYKGGRNKIGIDRKYGDNLPFNSWNQPLLRYTYFYEG